MKLSSKSLYIFLIILAISTISEAWYISDQQSQLDELGFRIASLQYQNTVLTLWCNKLEFNMSEIQEDFERQITEVQNEYDTLETDYLQLQRDYSFINYEMDNLQDRYEELQIEFEEYTEYFKDLTIVVNSRLALDGNLSGFVTPQDPIVIEKMIEASGGYSDPDSFEEYWEDAKAMNDWVASKVMYNSDSPYPYLVSDPSYPVRWLEHSARYPHETLADGTGDCEDQALLLLSMLMAHDDQYVKWGISLKWDGDGHVAVALPVAGGRLAILDPTNEYYSGTGLSLESLPLEEALESWIDLWGNPDVYVKSIFDDTLFYEFDSTEEFVEWFSTNFNQ